MAHFSNFRSYFSSVSRGLLLVVGLVVIAGLVAATFLYDDNANVATDNQTQEESVEEGADGIIEGEEGSQNQDSEGTQGGESGEGGDSANQNGEEDDSASQEDQSGAGVTGEGDDGEGTTGSDDENTVAAPVELAETGPEHVALAAFALGATIYGYRRSSKLLTETILG